MEFIEYYQIIRSRIWIAVMMAAAAFTVVTVYQLLPNTSWSAEGQLGVRPEALGVVQSSGNTANVVQNREFWGTIEQFVTSRDIRERTIAAAQQQAIIEPYQAARIKPFVFERSKRGDLFVIRGTGPSAEAARQIVTLGMEIIEQGWDAVRKAPCLATTERLKQKLASQRQLIQSLERQMDRVQTGTTAGRPTDRVTWIMNQINALQGSIANARTEVSIAQDRVTAWATQLQEEERQRAQGTLPAAPTGPVAALEARKLELELSRSQMLAHRTADHPEVVALDQQLRQVTRQLDQEKAKAAKSGGTSPTAVMSPSQQQARLAEIELRGAQRRLDAIVAEEARLRAQVPGLLAQARRYEDLENELKTAMTERAEITASLRRVEDEASRLDTTQDIYPLGEATSLPSPKTWSKYALMAVAATLAGLVMGCMLIFALHQIDLTFKNEAEAEHLLGYPVLAGIPRTDIALVPAAPEGVAEGPEPDRGG
ncbi:MAG: hypothetical protein HPY69_01285 [Armatimonadetes bacterium]|nr:hypothetical protein [Armatimonadota bacterium]